MISNFHTHTSRCLHATGAPADYIKQAAADGAGALGFSDHCPYLRDGFNTWDSIRMNANETIAYMSDVREAAKHAAFPVYAGFECEWAPRYESWYRDTLCGEYGADYLVFGSHWLLEGRNAIYAPDIFDREKIRRYLDFTIEGLKSGLYRILAHPDLIFAGGHGWNGDFASGFSDVIDAAIDMNVLLEINGYGIAKPKIRDENGVLRYQYPVDEFWELVAEKGARVICNSDAHDPEFVIEGVLKAQEYAAKFGLEPETQLF